MTAPQKERSQPDGAGSQGAHLGGVGCSKHMPQRVNLEDARQFLSVLDPDAKTWHFRVIDPAQQLRPMNFTGSLEEVADSLVAANAQGYGVFVTINKGGSKKEQITEIRAVFADFDSSEALKRLSANPDALKIGGREPHMIVKTSPGGLHVYWKLLDLNLDRFGPIQKAIAGKFGSDGSVHDLPRVMRLPGFLHTKAEPYLVTLKLVRDTAAFKAAELERAFLPAELPTSNPDSTRPAAYPEAGKVVAEERHSDLLQLAARYARQVVHDGVAYETALLALYAERDRGRWTREMLNDEVKKALDGAIAKFRSGEWSTAPEASNDSEKNSDAKLARVDIADLRSTSVPAAAYVFEPIVPRGVTTLLGGHGGTGKSLLTLSMAAHAAVGKAWAGFHVERPCKVVFASMEDPGAVVRFRLKNIAEHFSHDFDLLASNLVVVDGADIDATLVTESSSFGERKLRPTDRLYELAELAEGADLIVIDNASDTYDGDENNRRQVRFFLRLLSKVARRNNAGLILLAHIDKASAIHGSRANSYSGSTAWHNGPRSRLALTGEDSEGTLRVQMRHEKANLGPLAMPVWFTWAKTTAGGAVLVAEQHDPGTPRDVQQAEEAQIAADSTVIESVIRAATTAGIAVPSAMSGSATAMHTLADMPELPKKFRTAEGRKRVRRALVYLKRVGRLTTVEIKTSSRNTKEVFQLVVASDESAGAGYSFQP